MSDKNVNVLVSPGLFGATFLVFLVLKLTGHIDWSWWWVTAPLWGGLAIVIAILLAIVVVVAVGIGAAFLGAALWDGIQFLRRKWRKTRQSELDALFPTKE